MKPFAIEVLTPRVRAASGRVKVWTREISARRTRWEQRPGERANPIYILAAITLGVPILLLIPLIGMNPGVKDGSFASILTLLIGSAFVIAAVFEINRIADQPSETNHH